jgi:hypothetical protein
MMRDKVFQEDINNCMDVLEDYIIKNENDLIDKNAGDVEWQKLEKYKATLKNLEFLFSIYGV